MNIFNLASKLLSPQQHYDWGLRALKPVLKGCGNMLKMMKKSASTSKNSINESYIVVQALRLNTLSKLTYGDSIRFDTLVKDVFPNIVFDNQGHEELKEALVKLINNWLEFCTLSSALVCCFEEPLLSDVAEFFFFNVN